MSDSLRERIFLLEDYDLDATLSSGQAFRWDCRNGGWESVVHRRWVRLEHTVEGIGVVTAEDVHVWSELAEYLQVHLDLESVIKTFPNDPPMHEAMKACRGLRLLRQDPWECLASFILSSTKRIVQIQQIIRLLCERFGESVATPPNHEFAFAFPTVERIAACSESDLRACKMGFRAPYLLGTAQALMRSEVDLTSVAGMRADEARTELCRLPGVGRKIADCVLLFAFGFQDAFPVDVWVKKALHQLYFPQRRRINLQRLHEFSATHFGPNAGYAQQYLFHYMRTKWTARSPDRAARSRASRRRERTLNTRP